MTTVANKTQDSQEQQIWYIYINNETRGPLALRDLDVLLRTNQINSRTLGWKQGMAQWKVLNEIEEIKASILQSSKEIMEINMKRQSLFDKGPKKQGQQQNEPKNQQQVQDAIIQNKDQDPLTILQATVQNLIKKSFYQSQDGQWNVYDDKSQQWKVQNQQPTEQIEMMKKSLFNKLKNELFFEHRNTRRNKIQKEQKNQPEEPLTEEQIIKRQKNRKKTKRMAQKKKQKWYKSKINTFIYISGLPLDITEQQLRDFAGKAGVVRVDLNTGSQKIKIYKDQDGYAKGDAAVSYAREQSVDIALQNLNNSEIRPGFPVKIQKASFQQKNKEYIPRQTKKVNKINKVLAKKKELKQFSWDEGEQIQGQGLQIVVLKNIFPYGCENTEYIESVKKEMTEQMQKIGTVKRIRFYEAHPDGVVQVKFSNDKEAQSCIDLLNGRFYDQREIVAQYWDGQTDYKKSGLLDIERLEKFGKQLQQGPQPNENRNLERINEESNEQQIQQQLHHLQQLRDMVEKTKRQHQQRIQENKEGDNKPEKGQDL